MNLTEIVYNGFERYNAHDTDALIAQFDPNAVVCSPMYPAGTGLDQHRENLDAIFTAFGDIRAEAELVSCEPGRVTAQFHVTGTHSGPLRIPGDRTHEPTGNEIAFRGTLMQDFDDAGLIVAEHTYWDTPALLGQLGIELSEPTPR